MKRKRLMFLALLLVATGLRAQTLVLWHADGTTTDVELYTQPQVKFQDDKVVITSTVLSMEYAKADVLRFTYKGGSIAAGIPAAKASVSQENGQLVFHGVKAGEPIAVYTSNGIRIPVRLTRHGDSATLPLSAIPSGVYLLSVNGRTSKFTKP